MIIRNPFALAGLSLGTTCLLLAVFVLSFKRTKLHRIWILFNLSVAIWGFGAFLIGNSQNPTSALFAWRIAHIGGIFIPVCFFHTVALFCGIEERLKKVIVFAYAQGFLFLLLDSTNLFISKVRIVFNSFYYNESTGLLYPIFFFIWIALVIWGHYELIFYYLKSLSTKRNQILYFFVGMFVGFLGGTTNFFPMFYIDIYPFGNFTIPLYCFIVTYAIFKYRLMDIKVAITRAGLFLFVYTFILGLPFALTGYYRDWLMKHLGINWWLFPLGVMAIFSTVGPFLYIFLQKRAEEKLFQEQKRYQDVLKRAAIGMTRIRNLRKLLSLVTHIVTKTVRISFAAIYLYDRQTNEYSLQVFHGKQKGPLDVLPADSALVKWLSLKQEPLIYEEIKAWAQDLNVDAYKRMEEELRQLSASVIVPSSLDQKLIGFLILGDKLSGQIYTPDDLNVFHVLASQAALAIENAQFYDEAKELQAQIAQAEKMATIGTMADGLSHQINNRFYALSLISGDSLDTLKLADASKYPHEIQQILNQLKSALERILANVTQGGEVVKGILKYTRKGDEGLEPLTIDQILNGTIDMVQFKVKLSEIDIVKNYSKEIPKVKANLVQMQEVFFNFIDNAYDSIVERRNELKEEGYRGKITITAAHEEKIMRIIIQDNGMGVRKEDIKKIFTPFFTTKISSRKGTGLGLYVIRNIILETHKGKIDFSSEYKGGTCFKIEIPLAL